MRCIIACSVSASTLQRLFRTGRSETLGARIEARFNRLLWRERLFGKFQTPYCLRKCCFGDRRGVAVRWFRCPSDAQLSRTTPSHTKHCMASAAGYTRVDTANGDRHQKGVGRAIRVCSTQSRDKLLVTTKILGGLARSVNPTAHAESIDQLRLDDVDHLMVHYPGD